MDLLAYEDVCSVSLVTMRMSEIEIEFIKTAIDYIIDNLSDKEIIEVFVYEEYKHLQLPEDEEDDEKDILERISNELQNILITTVRDEDLPGVFKHKRPETDTSSQPAQDEDEHKASQLAVQRVENGWVVVDSNYTISRLLIEEVVVSELAPAEANTVLLPETQTSASKVLVLELTNGEATAQLRLANQFLLDDGKSQHRVRPGQLADLTPVLQLLHKQVTAICAHYAGRLQVVIDEAVRLVVEPHGDYQAWELNAQDGSRLVGGRLTGVIIWPAPAF